MSTPSHHTTIHSNRALFELDASPSDSSDKTNTYALIVLNTPLTPDSLLFRVIWPRGTSPSPALSSARGTLLTRP